MKNPLRSALQPFADTHAEGWLVAATFAASALQGSAFSYPLPQVVVAEVVAVGGPSPGVQRFLSINGDEEGSWVASARAPTYSDQVLYGVLAGSGTTTPGILRAPQVIGGYDQALVTQGRVLAGRIAYTSLTFVQPIGYSSWIDDDLLAASGMAIGTTGMQWTDSSTPRLTRSTESFVLGRAIPTGTTAPPVELVVRYPDESIVLLEGGNVQGLSGPVTDIWSFETSPSGD